VKQTIIIRDWHLKQQAKALIDSLPLEDPHEISVRPWKSKRSLQQNRYLFGVVYERIRLHVQESTGEIYSAEDIHEAMKQKFLPADIVEIGDERFTVARTTTRLTVREFAEYVDSIIGYAAEHLGLVVPAPDEEWYEQEARRYA